MSNFYEELKKYFEDTPREKVLEDWKMSEHLDNVGITVEEFLDINNIKKVKTFYRVCNLDTKQGLWYDIDGKFTGLIHDKFSFCENSKLPMPYDENVIGYLSSVENLEDLYFWFTKEDIKKLNMYNYFVYKYESVDYKYYNNHWLISKEHSKVVEKIKIV